MRNYLNLADIDRDVAFNQMAGLQRDNLLQQMTRQKRQIAEEDALNSAFNESMGDKGIDGDSLVKKLVGKGLGQRAYEVQSGLAKNKLAQQSAQQEQKSAALDMAVKAAKYSRDKAAQWTPQTYAQGRAELIQQGIIKPEELPEEYNPDVHKAFVMDADSFVKQQTQEAKAPTSRTIRQGNDQVTQEFDPKTGQWTEVGRGSAFSPNSGINIYSSPQAGVDANGNPVFFQTGKDGAPPKIVQGVTPPAPTKKTTGLSAAAQKELFDAEDSIEGSKAAIEAFDAALSINDKAMGGLGSGALANIGGVLPKSIRPDAVDATQELDNILQGSALPQLKAIFGGMPTEGERAILLEVQGSSAKPASVRKGIFERAKAAAEKRIKYNTEKVQKLRSGSYFTDDGGIAVDSPKENKPAPKSYVETRTLKDGRKIGKTKDGKLEIIK